MRQRARRSTAIRRVGPILPALCAALALGAAGWAIVVQGGRPAPAPRGADAAARPPRASTSQAWLLDPAPVGDAGGFRRGTAAPEAGFRPTVARPSPPVEAFAAPERVVAPTVGPIAAVGSIAAGAPAPVGAPAVARAPEAVRPVAPVPLLLPRPAEFGSARAADPAPRLAERLLPRRARIAALAAKPAVDDRSFFEKLFGVDLSAEAAKPAPITALAYASAGTDPVEAPRARISPGLPTLGGGTAVYDIGARQVRLPSGEVLEAHSGLGAYMDDARYVHVRMRGPTPLGTYDLTEREALFHGVRAIRLTPQGGAGAIHGRDGILAHTYMLGPTGASNGCVSFRDYERFLQAYLRGEVRRLVVVAGGRGDPSPNARFGAIGAPRDRDG